EDNKLKPGMVAHYLAIQECLKDPAIREYDFLAGQQRYKKSMATGERPLDWVSLMRGTPTVRLFQLLRRLRGYLRPTPVTSP
ncbi:MAG: GNAT family N-acetyltransferase, partial [Bryobacteraceae bacterium]|nr:GNAT family N-acetyltransferase [Bryobacteraceae bacterium]